MNLANWSRCLVSPVKYPWSVFLYQKMAAFMIGRLKVYFLFDGSLGILMFVTTSGLCSEKSMILKWHSYATGFGCKACDGWVVRHVIGTRWVFKRKKLQPG